MVWATASLSLTNNPLLVATDSVSQEFSIWQLPNRGQDRFANKYNDEIAAVKACV